MNSIQIRNATIKDLNSIYEIEQISFPPGEAASLSQFEQRLQVFPNHFWLLELNNKVIGHINGIVSNSDRIYDDMFKYTELHDENGQWQSIFGIAVLPEHRNNGYAGMLINRLIEASTQQNRKGIILTCKAPLIAYYTKFGFINIGLSDSKQGGQTWYDMKLELSY